MDGLHVTLAASDRDLEDILQLQALNHRSVVSSELARSQGFVTVEHSLELLRAMHQLAPSVIARQGDALAGYALMMPVEARPLVPILEPMFEMLEGLEYGSRPLLAHKLYVMGQICVASAARGSGVFDALYAGHRRYYGSSYDCVVTEVATRNTRSMRAHQRVGFRTIHQYRDATDEWAVLAWDFGEPLSPSPL
jgi:ribosomal protein S18 acetylase RimI-like enzyme